MSKMVKAFCTDCGTELEQGAKFCANCGAIVPISQSEQGHQEEPIQPKAQQQMQAPVSPQQERPMQQHAEMKPPVAPQPLQHSQSQYQSQPQQQYTAPPQGGVRTSNSNEALSVFGYVLTMLALAVPIVGIILIFVWAFGANTNLARKNYSRAVLIMALVFIVISITLAVSLSSALIPLIEVLSEYN